MAHMIGLPQIPYLNMDSNHKYAEFYYEFKFGSDKIIYKYKKESLYKLLFEELYYNGKKYITLRYEWLFCIC